MLFIAGTACQQFWKGVLRSLSSPFVHQTHQGVSETSSLVLLPHHERLAVGVGVLDAKPVRMDYVLSIFSGHFQPCLGDLKLCQDSF